MKIMSNSGAMPLEEASQKFLLQSSAGNRIPLDPLPKGFFLMHGSAETGSSCRVWVKEGLSEFDRFGPVSLRSWYRPRSR